MQDLRVEDEHIIPDDESVGIVEGLEIVQVGMDDAHVQVFVDGLLDLLLDRVVAREPGQGIGVDGGCLHLLVLTHQLVKLYLGAYPREEFAEVARLDDVVDPARRITLVDFFRGSVARDENNRDVLPGRIPLEAPAQFVSFHFLHLSVDEEQVGDHGFEDRQRVLTSTGAEHFVTLVTEGGGMNPQILEGFIDDEDFGLGSDQG